MHAHGHTREIFEAGSSAAANLPPSSLPASSLPASLDLTRAEALYMDLRATLAEHGALLLDGSAVEYVSTACAQILVAAALAARAGGHAFTLAAPSIVLQHALHDLGLGAMLGLAEPQGLGGA